MSLNDLTEEQLVALLRERLQRTSLAQAQELESNDQFSLPNEIWDDLENTQETAARANITSWLNELPNYEGGKWTKTGSLNKDLHGHVRQHRLDALTIIFQKYRNGDRLRNAGRAATEIYEELASFIQRERNATIDEEDLHRILERVRRLAVFSFTSGKLIDNEAKTISDKALGISTPDPNGAMRDLAYSPEELEAWEEKRFRQSILRASTAPRFQSFRGRGNGGRRFNKNPRNFFRRRQNDRPRQDQNFPQSANPTRE